MQFIGMSDITEATSACTLRGERLLVVRCTTFSHKEKPFTRKIKFSWLANPDLFS